jgi:hypothetical protein
VHEYYAVASDNDGGMSNVVSTTNTVEILFSIDVDGNGTADALTDGILILRYLFDPPGQWNYSDALGSGATRTTHAAIKSYLDLGATTGLDVDGNGAADALTDGILTLRYLFDPPGQWNYSDALGSGATRTSRTQIKAFLDVYNPSLAPAPSVIPDTPLVVSQELAPTATDTADSPMAAPLPAAALPVATDENLLAALAAAALSNQAGQDPAGKDLLSNASAAALQGGDDEVLQSHYDGAIHAAGLRSLDTALQQWNPPLVWRAIAAHLGWLNQRDAANDLWNDDVRDWWLPLGEELSGE